MPFIKNTLNYSPVPAAGFLIMFCLATIGIPTLDILGLALISTITGALILVFLIGATRLYRHLSGTAYNNSEFPLRIIIWSWLRLCWVPFYFATLTTAYLVRSGYTLEDIMSWTILIKVAMFSFCIGILVYVCF